jgi:6-phosphogluconate dehydrogenase
MIGLGTMGRNLLLNMAEHGFAVAGYDRDSHQVKLLRKEAGELPATGYHSLDDFISSLERPRSVMLLVPAGKAVDEIIAELLPKLQKGDLIIDGGNSHFSDTDSRASLLMQKGIQFLGSGISGGEEGARRGPSIMPGGDTKAYEQVRGVFEAIAAKVSNEPCVAHMGAGSAGHFVKMVHNGIEYAIMQLIAETYELMRSVLGLTEDEMQTIFNQWNFGRLQSYLLEITIEIVAQRDSDDTGRLINFIKDEARSKGTGRWTSQTAMDLHVPIPTIDVAVSMRDLSAFKSLRMAISQEHETSGLSNTTEKVAFLAMMEQALFASMITAYAQGMHLLTVASEAMKFYFDLAKIPLIWRGGCIIRSGFLTAVHNAYKGNPKLEHLFLDPYIAARMKAATLGLRSVVGHAQAEGVAVPAHASVLSYYDSIRAEKMPTNLIQAQRDYFGAHTYERTDKPGVFHTQWSKKPE